jgi:hypothetical protein
VVEYRVAFQIGDRVRYKPEVMTGATRLGLIGTVTSVMVISSNEIRIDVRWDDERCDPGIMAALFEPALPR